jgi:hypothetical protein
MHIAALALLAVAQSVNNPPNAQIDTPSAPLTVIQVGQTVTFTGTGTDSDGTIASYSWNFGGGAPNSSAQDPGPVQFNTPGLFTVVFNVTDNQGASDPTLDFRQIQVNQPPPPPNQPPNATIDTPAGGLTVIQVGQAVNFTGSASDPNGVVVSYSWNFAGGAPNSSVEDPGNVQFNTPGFFTVVFNVTDNQGASDPTPPSHQVQVNQAPPGPNQPPNATIDTPTGNVTITAGQSVVFTGTGTDPEGSISSYVWRFPGGSPASSSVADPGSVLFSAPGVFTVTFNVTDGQGVSDTSPATRIITVTQPPPSNVAPEATIEAPTGSVAISVDESVNFQGSASDSDGRITAYRWDFGGGAPNRSVEDPGLVRFTIAGTFTVTFNVTDDRGASDPTPPSLSVVVGSGGGSIDVHQFNVEVEAAGSGSRVDGHDVLFVLRAIVRQDLRADVNADGRVDELDVQRTLAALGEVE